jgi:uncharacterized protein (DUF2062 family)
MPELRTMDHDRLRETSGFRILSPRWWWHEFLRQFGELRGKPHEIALGMAIGVFIGITPTIPFHTLLAVSLAVFARGSKLAAALGVWVSNPLTIPLFYCGSYRIGQFVLGLPGLRFPEEHSLLLMAKLGGEIVGAMVLGGAILGIIPAVFAYVLTLRLVSSPGFCGCCGERQE